ncbi:GNAT family N-acetyltransferase [Rhodovulum iodosum]|uniref:GNAT family N-acetyltransferase n=1 Tax=Rhodovulum iodosum TaxID=68291 RepID=UPI001B86CC0C|nr:GNAT family N-acetyltransferase [Rhodovulum robiginosum]
METPRLRLGPIGQDDLPALIEIGAHPLVAPMMGSITVPWPETAARLWVERGRFRGWPRFRLGIYEKAGGLVGAAGLGGAPVSLAYFLGPDHWGRGYATEAARGLIGAVFDRFSKLDLIAADCFADNPASARVLEKLGFERTGTGTGHSLARLEPAPNIHYRLSRRSFEARDEIP